MASPTFSTRRTPAREARRGGFTLAEILIAFGLSSILLTGVMTTFVMMGRTGQLAQNYTELEVQARKALEQFSREARMANKVTAYSEYSVTMGIPDSSWDRTVTAYYARYTFDRTNLLFKRETLDTSNNVTSTTTLVTNIQPIGTNPYIRYFRYVGASTGYTSGFQTNYASNTTEIKQVELNFIAKRTSTTVASATDKVLSARFILRNK